MQNLSLLETNKLNSKWQKHGLWIEKPYDRILHYTNYKNEIKHGSEKRYYKKIWLQYASFNHGQYFGENVINNEIIEDFIDSCLGVGKWKKYSNDKYYYWFNKENLEHSKSEKISYAMFAYEPDEDDVELLEAQRIGFWSKITSEFILDYDDFISIFISKIKKKYKSYENNRYKRYA